MNQKQKKYGITPIRKCKQEEINLIKEKLEELKPIFQQNREEKGQYLHWVNIYLNDKYCWQSQQKEAKFRKWVQEIVSQVQQGVPQHVTIYGIINNPAGCIQNQPFHFDYHRQYKSLFVPMTYLVYQNSTQFFSFPFKSEPTVNERGIKSCYGFNQKQLLEQEGVDYLVSSQVISKPFVILKLQSETIHRAIANSTKQDRYMLFIGYSQLKLSFPLERPADY